MADALVFADHGGTGLEFAKQHHLVGVLASEGLEQLQRRCIMAAEGILLNLPSQHPDQQLGGKCTRYIPPEPLSPQHPNLAGRQRKKMLDLSFSGGDFVGRAQFSVPHPQPAMR